MNFHRLKIEERYWNNIQNKRKKFEIRYNDRDYQVGDLIRFVSVDNDLVIPNITYKITYIHTGLGLQAGYVVLGITESGNE